MRWSLLPPGATPDAGVLLRSRGLRAIGDGFVSVLLPVHLLALGFGPLQIGVLTTAMLLGSAALTLAVGLLGYRLPRRQLLLRVSLLMIGTGLGFAIARDFWPVLAVGLVGTLNPSSGDVSVFLPTEQALLPETVPDTERTALFARYSLIGSLLVALGALAAAVPALVAGATGWQLSTLVNAMFVVYAFLGILVLLSYRSLSPAIDVPERPVTPLRESRGIVFRLAALFSLDSFASGLVIQSLLALWLLTRFSLPVTTTSLIFFWSGLLAAVSALASVRLARRIGLINTAVFTHLPANLFLIAAPFMPTVELAVAMLLLRSLLAQMDVPVRNSYVAAVVRPAERPAAASITTVPKSLASALGPLLSGYLFALSPFGWPLVLAGSLKAAYDLLLLRNFRSIRPPEEAPQPQLPSGARPQTPPVANGDDRHLIVR